MSKNMKVLKSTRKFKNKSIKKIKQINKLKSRKRIRLQQTRKYNKKNGGLSRVSPRGPQIGFNESIIFDIELAEIEINNLRKSRPQHNDILTYKKKSETIDSLTKENGLLIVINAKIKKKIDKLKSILKKIETSAEGLKQYDEKSGLTKTIINFKKSEDTQYVGGFFTLFTKPPKIAVSTDSTASTETDSTASTASTKTDSIASWSETDSNPDTDDDSIFPDRISFKSDNLDEKTLFQHDDNMDFVRKDGFYFKDSDRYKFVKDNGYRYYKFAFNLLTNYEEKIKKNEETLEANKAEISQLKELFTPLKN